MTGALIIAHIINVILGIIIAYRFVVTGSENASDQKLAAIEWMENKMFELLFGALIIIPCILYSYYVVGKRTVNSLDFKKSRCEQKIREMQKEPNCPFLLDEVQSIFKSQYTDCIFKAIRCIDKAYVVYKNIDDSVRKVGRKEIKTMYENLEETLKKIEFNIYERTIADCRLVTETISSVAEEIKEEGDNLI